MKSVSFRMYLMCVNLARPVDSIARGSSLSGKILNERAEFLADLRKGNYGMNEYETEGL